MPKEVIRYSNDYVIRSDDASTLHTVVYLAGDLPREGEEVKHDEEIALHWSKGDGGIIQLSIQLDAEMVREQLRLYDAEQWMGEEIKPGMLMFYSGGLERYELQKLIRFTRQARNDVHGADE